MKERGASLAHGQRVLDLGCGVGQVAARLHDLGADVVGVDSSDELLATARDLHPQLRFEKADLRDVDSERFGLVDGVWASFVAAYFPDLRSMVAQWSKCLRPGGWLALVEVAGARSQTPCALPGRASCTKECSRTTSSASPARRAPISSKRGAIGSRAWGG